MLAAREWKKGPSLGKQTWTHPNKLGTLLTHLGIVAWKPTRRGDRKKYTRAQVDGQTRTKGKTPFVGQKRRRDDTVLSKEHPNPTPV